MSASRAGWLFKGAKRDIGSRLPLLPSLRGEGVNWGQVCPAREQFPATLSDVFPWQSQVNGPWLQPRPGVPAAKVAQSHSLPLGPAPTVLRF